MLPQLRDWSFLDNTASTAAAFSVPLPQSDPGDPNADPPVPPTISVQDGDWGVLVLVWTAALGTPFTRVLSDTWDTLVPPTVANKLCLAVLGRQYDSADPPTVDFTLELGRYLLAVGTWWTGVAKADVPGPVGVNSPAVSVYAAAPPMTASGVSDERLLSVFVTTTNQGPLQMTVTDLAPDPADLLQVWGSPGKAMLSIGYGAGSGLGPTDAMVATYNQGSQSRAGVQLGLLATGARVGGSPMFGPTVTLAATGTALLADAPAFAAEVDLAIPRILLGSRASLGPTVTLRAKSFSKNPVRFAASLALSTSHNARVAKAGFRATVTLKAAGHKKVAVPVSFAPHVTLAATGRQRLFGRPSFNLAVGLATTGRMKAHGRIKPTTSVRLAATGTPHIPGTVRLASSVRLVSHVHRMSASGSIAQSMSIKLHPRTVLVRQAGRALFGAQVSLTVQGIPDLTPIGTPYFAPAVTLAAEGFASQVEPVGISLHPLVPAQIQAWSST